MVLPEDDAPYPRKMIDLLMLVATGGQERTQSQYRQLRGEIRSAGSLDYPQIILGPALSLSVIMLLFSDRKPVDVERYFEAHVDLVLNGLLPRNGDVS